MNLKFRFKRACSRAEIVSVGISPSTSAAFAIYNSGQVTQSWIDVFDLETQRSYSKTTGSLAVFGPQGSRLATFRDCSVTIRDFGTGKTMIDLKEAHGEPVAWSRDGRVVASSEDRNRMSVWDVKTGARVGRVVSHIDTITHAGFTPDLHLVTLSKDGTLRITNPTTMKTVSRLEISSTNPRAMGISQDGQRIVSVWGTTVHLWVPSANDLTSYNLNTVRKTEGWPLCISPDCRYMACWTEEGFDVMDVATGAVAFEKKEDALITAGAWSNDGKVLMLGRMDGFVEVWDVEEKR